MGGSYTSQNWSLLSFIYHSYNTLKTHEGLSSGGKQSRLKWEVIVVKPVSQIFCEIRTQLYTHLNSGLNLKKSNEIDECISMKYVVSRL